LTSGRRQVRDGEERRGADLSIHKIGSTPESDLIG